MTLEHLSHVEKGDSKDTYLSSKFKYPIIIKACNEIFNYLVFMYAYVCIYLKFFVIFYFLQNHIS